MIAAARYKGAEEVDPPLFCCEALRASAVALAGTMFKVDTGQVRVNKVKCGYCGAVRDYRLLRIVEGPEGTVGGWLHVGCIDIEEGV